MGNPAEQEPRLLEEFDKISEELMPLWRIESVEVSGGFLGGLSIPVPAGLTCVIGPRGSGKSTLAEAIRHAVAGSVGASKARADLIQANLSSAVITLRTCNAGGQTDYTIRRVGREPATLLTADGKNVTSIDLERGTFLPLDAYSSWEVEAIADESLGARRRNLLDELRSDELHQISLAVAEKRRALDENADAIRTARRTAADLTERLESLAGARARLAALPPATPSESSEALSAAARQHHANAREKERGEDIIRHLRNLGHQIESCLEGALEIEAIGIDGAASANQALIEEANAVVAASISDFGERLRSAALRLRQAEEELNAILLRVARAHEAQGGKYAALRAENHAVSEAVRARQESEQAVTVLSSLELQVEQTRERLAKLYSARKELKAEYLLERDRVSDIREEIARRLQSDAGGKIRVRVLRNADSLGYRASLTDALRGARVKNHDDILDCLMRLRPEQVAQIVADQDLNEFEHQTSMGTERCRKILESFRLNLDPLELEVIASDDRVGIELDVSTNGSPNYKDAAELSRGQKCTALLPLLLARRDTPLLIDQPEDNLDNHFIYETVVESIRRLKTRRQMIFITHNSNIPVLAEAELIVVLNSDGKSGFVEKMGTLDECRDEIIDLLEGGKEAFEQRRLRYQGLR